MNSTTNEKLIKAALEVEECFWRTFPYQDERPMILRSCIDDLRAALQEAGHTPAFSDEWVEVLRNTKYNKEK